MQNQSAFYGNDETKSEDNVFDSHWKFKYPSPGQTISKVHITTVKLVSDDK